MCVCGRDIAAHNAAGCAQSQPTAAPTRSAPPDGAKSKSNIRVAAAPTDAHALYADSPHACNELPMYVYVCV